MNAVTTIDGAGRLLVPVSMRRSLNLAGGSRVRLEIVAGHIEMTPESEAAPLTRKGGRLILKSGGRRTDAVALVRAERDAQARRGSGR